MFSLVGIATRAIRNGREKSKSAPEESFEIQIKDKKHKVEVVHIGPNTGPVFFVTNCNSNRNPNPNP